MEYWGESFAELIWNTSVPHTVGKSPEQPLEDGVHVQEDNSLIIINGDELAELGNTE